MHYKYFGFLLYFLFASHVSFAQGGKIGIFRTLIKAFASSERQSASAAAHLFKQPVAKSAYVVSTISFDANKVKVDRFDVSSGGKMFDPDKNYYTADGHQIPGFLARLNNNQYGSNPLVRNEPRDLQLYVFADETDEHCYDALKRTRFLNKNLTPLVALSDALEKVDVQYGKDPFIKGKSAIRVIERIALIEDMHAYGYLSHYNYALGSRVVLDAKRVYDEAIKQRELYFETRAGQYPAFYAPDIRYTSVYEDEYGFSKALGRDINQGITLMKEIGILNEGVKPGYFDNDIKITAALTAFNKERNTAGFRDFSTEHIGLLKEEKKRNVAFKKFLNRNFDNNIRINPVIDRKAAEVVNKNFPGLQVVPGALLAESDRLSVVHSHYIERLQTANLDFSDNAGFFDAFYKNNCPEELAGYYRENGEEFFIFKNNDFPGEVFAIRKTTGGIVGVADVKPVLHTCIRHFMRTVAAKSTSEVSFVYLSPILDQWSNFALQYGKERHILKKDELALFLDGAPAEKYPALSAALNAIPAPNLVVLRDPFLQMENDVLASTRQVNDIYMKGEHAINPATFVLKIQELKLKTAIYLASDFSLAIRNLQRKPPVISRFVVGNPGSGYKVKNYGLLETLSSRLSNNYFSNGLQKPVNDFDVFASIGHRDAEYKRYITDLAASGVLDGKLKLSFICYVKNEENWTSGLLKNSDVAGMLYFYREIAPDAVRKVVIRYLERSTVNGFETNDIVLNIRTIIEECIGDPKNKLLAKDLNALLTTLLYQLSSSDYQTTSHYEPGLETS